MKAIIPTGGRGTRMRPITYSSNKHFIPIANKPLIFYPIEAVVKAGVQQIGITYNPGGLEQAEEILGDGSKFGIEFTYILQEKPTGGLANIIQVCEDFINGDRLLLHLGDNIFINGIKDLVEYFAQENSNALVTMVKHKDNSRLGVPFFDENGKFNKYVEKPENPPNAYGIPGLYFFDQNVFKAFKGKDKIEPSERGELEIGSLYNWLMANGFQVTAKEYKGKWLDPGKFDDWIETNRYILDEQLESRLLSEISDDTLLEGRVRISKHCQVENSHIRGPVIIGDNVKIKDSYIGPFTSIADNCVIESSHVENSVLMPAVQIIGARQPIDTSMIGTGSQVIAGKGPSMTMKLFIGEKSKVEA